VRKLFVSYARVNRAQVDQLVEHLGLLGCQTWIDSSLQGGQQWWEQILRKIADADVFFPVISRDSLNSMACQREFEWAEALGKPMLPVAVEPLSRALSPRLAQLHVIDYFDPAQRDRNALSLAGALAALPAAPPLPQPMPTPPAAPLSYLTSLADLVSGAQPLDHEQQRQVLVQLESALRSVDAAERQGGLDILERFSSRENLYADVDRRLDWLKANTPSTSPDKSAKPRRAAQRASVAQTAAGGSKATSKRRKLPLVLGATAVVIALAGVAGYLVWPGSNPAKTGTEQAALPGGPAAAVAGGQPSHAAAPGVAAPGGQAAQPVPPGGHAVLPFSNLLGARGVAVDSAGNVYAAAQNGVFELAAGSSAPVQLPVSAGQPVAVAVDSAGAVYVADTGRNTVWKLPAGSNTPAAVQFNGLKCGEREIPLGGPMAVAVDSHGNLFVADGACQGRVVTLPAGSSTASVLPFVGLNQIGGVAVDGSGNVYVTDGAMTGDGRVQQLAAGSSRPSTLPFPGLKAPQSVAVDSTGNVYVTDDAKKQILKLSAGSTTPTALSVPSTTFANGPYGLAVDHTGNIYVTDGSQVVKLAAG
jgi:hypothetical protein